jgi:hypothetical protein
MPPNHYFLAIVRLLRVVCKLHSINTKKGTLATKLIIMLGTKYQDSIEKPQNKYSTP